MSERNLPWAFGEEEEEEVNKFKREVARREPCLPATRPPSSLSRLPRFSFFSSLLLLMNDFLFDTFFLDSPPSFLFTIVFFFNFSYVVVAIFVWFLVCLSKYQWSFAPETHTHTPTPKETSV